MLQGLYFQGPQGEQVKAEVATTYPPPSQSWFQLTKTRPAEKKLELNFLFFFFPIEQAKCQWPWKNKASH